VAIFYFFSEKARPLEQPKQSFHLFDCHVVLFFPQQEENFPLPEEEKALALLYLIGFLTSTIKLDVIHVILFTTLPIFVKDSVRKS
jgi:hypothetical protein